MDVYGTKKIRNVVLLGMAALERQRLPKRWLI